MRTKLEICNVYTGARLEISSLRVPRVVFWVIH